MPRGIFNWTFADVDRFLRDHGFRVDHKHTAGSHYFYHGSVENKLKIVHVPFHGSFTIKPKTIKTIILQSGISKEEWIARNN